MEIQPPPITNFFGEYRFLSNFFPASVVARVSATLLPCPTVEHAYQAMKMTDWEAAVQIQNASTPGEAKRMAWRFPCRKDWDGIKVQVMEDLLNQKFRHPVLAMRLKATGERPLIEGNTWGDRFWGAVREGDHWTGSNWLGQLLMRVRKELPS